VRSVTRPLHLTRPALATKVPSGCASFVVVVEAADFRECDDVTLADALHASRHGRILR
jgi:hypothetical protein